MNASLFIFRLEEEIKAVKIDIERTKKRTFPSLTTKINATPWKDDESLDQLKLWFLRSLQNTDLEHEGFSVDPVELLKHKALETERIPPFRPRFPFLLWILCQIDNGDISEIFGDSFLLRRNKLVQSSGFGKWIGVE